jgi:integrase
MGRKRTPGLRKRGNVWHIEKQIQGFGSLYESTGTSDLQEAERYLAHRLEGIRQQVVYGVRPVRTFRQAATKYLEEVTKRSIDRDARCLAIMDPYLGDLPITKVHMGTLQHYIKARQKLGIKSATISRELAVVRRILNLAARLWRDESDRPWLDTAPMIVMPNWDDARAPYPLSWDEQARLLKELPTHLARMALFKLKFF